MVNQIGFNASIYNMTYSGDKIKVTSVDNSLEYILHFFNFCAGIIGICLNLFVIYALLVKYVF